MTNDMPVTPESSGYSRRQVLQYSGLAAAAVGGARCSPRAAEDPAPEGAGAEAEAVSPAAS